MARWIVLAGVTALLLIGYFAIQYPADGWGRHNVLAITAALQQRAEAALAKLGATWATVTVDGQIATLTGEAPTDNDRQDALDAVRAADWAGGKWIGGITLVRNETTLAKPVSPYKWSAQSGERGRVRLTGDVPGQRHRAAIKAEAQRLFPLSVDDQMTIAQGAPTGPWADTAVWALAQLSQLSSGEAIFTDKQVTLRGAAPNASVVSDIEKAAAKIKTTRKPYEATTDIKLTTALDVAPVNGSEPASAVPAGPAAVTAPVAPTPAPPVQSVAAADCQKLIDKVMANNTIEFASGSSEIRSVVHGMLDRLAEAATLCGTMKIRITGHSDASPAELANSDLSQARANAVASYLTAKGVARNRLVAFGAGSGQPIGDNGTPAGQAKNRRIEISVTN